MSGVSILLFWYRNEIYAIEARSAACSKYFTTNHGSFCEFTDAAIMC